VTLMHFSLPFAVLPIYASMRGISDSEVEAARDLGAGRWQILSTVIVPRCQSGIVAGFSFVFLMVGGDYVTPLLVGGKLTMIGNLIAPQFGAQFNWPLGAAMSIVMLIAAVAIIYLFRLLVALWSRQ
jgi:spermidine/putrescine transport system permease protein